MNNKVAVVVVTYNRKKLLQKNIKALLAQTYKNILDILVMDNASTDSTKESIQQYINNKDIIAVEALVALAA